MKLLRYIVAASVLAALGIAPSALAHHRDGHDGGPPTANQPGGGNAGGGGGGQTDPGAGQGGGGGQTDPGAGQGGGGGQTDPGQGNPGQGNPNPGQGNPGQGNPNPGQGNPNPGRGNQGRGPRGEPPHGVAAGHDKIALCHATGSETNPFSIIEIPRKQWDKGVGHGGHDHDFPLPQDGQCEGHQASLPGTALAAGIPPTEPGEVVAGEVVTAPVETREPGEDVLGSGVTRPVSAPEGGEEVQAGVLASNLDNPEVAAARSGALPFTGADDKELLFTGFGLSLIFIGLGAWGLTRPAKALER